jgi:predicted DCC family thiol-disulfide oxidoreductase YuxK
MKASKKEAIILFDGVCNLCNSSVQFVLQHDNKNQFLFASLQSDAAHKLLLQFNYENDEMMSIILIEDDKIYDKSTAALKIGKKLHPPWNFLYSFIIIPKALRDFIYNIIANNRYRWFGKRETCLLYNGKYKNRFIQN